MELPTYTNIWKIEKRLYKLYDFRLPMPLPIGQVAAFLAIAIPYMLILTMAGMPFSHTWVWLYVLPPGLLTWLVTRPVIEGKRLPELVLSQLRYLSEPRTWCRMTPFAEDDQILVSARVWRQPPCRANAGTPLVTMASAGDESSGSGSREFTPLRLQPEIARERVAPIGYADSGSGGPGRGLPRRRRGRSAPVPVADVAADDALADDALATDALETESAAPESDTQPGAERPVGPRIRVRGAARGQQSASQQSHVGQEDSALSAAAADEEAADGLRSFKPVWPSRPAMSASAVAVARTGLNPADVPAAAPEPELPDAGPAPDRPAVAEPALPRPVQAPERPAAASDQSAVPAARKAVTIQTPAGALEPLPVVERALRTSAGGLAGWRDRVVVVPGGHRPGQPDPVQRDQARARLPLSGPARIAVIGCTAGAGQTVTTLLAGQLMASLRAEPVAVLDLGAGDQSLTELARQVPRLVPSRTHGHWPAGAEDPRERGLQVVTADDQAEDTDAAALIQTVAARYPLMFADPPAMLVPRAVQVADQLVLVAPAGANAAGALAMTLEWLETHGQEDLARAAVVVLNGVSEHTEPQVARAAAVAAGRCRAVLRVPWDTAHGGTGALSVASLQAYTALAGVVIAGLSGRTAAADNRMQGSGR